MSTEQSTSAATVEQLTPTENTDIRHIAAGNLGFLLSIIRSGDTLNPDEEANVRKIIEELETIASSVQRNDEWIQGRRAGIESMRPLLRDAAIKQAEESDGEGCQASYGAGVVCGRKRESHDEYESHPFVAPAQAVKSGGVNQVVEQSTLESDLLRILISHVGESGTSEGAVEVLTRLVQERYTMAQAITLGGFARFLTARAAIGNHANTETGKTEAEGLAIAERVASRIAPAQSASAREKHGLGLSEPASCGDAQAVSEPRHVEPGPDDYDWLSAQRQRAEGAKPELLSRLECERLALDIAQNVEGWLYGTDELIDHDSVRAEIEARAYSVLVRAVSEPPIAGVDPASLSAERCAEILNAANHRERDCWHARVEQDHLKQPIYTLIYSKPANETPLSYVLTDARLIAAYHLEHGAAEGGTK